MQKNQKTQPNNTSKQPNKKFILLAIALITIGLISTLLYFLVPNPLRTAFTPEETEIVPVYTSDSLIVTTEEGITAEQLEANILAETDLELERVVEITNDTFEVTFAITEGEYTGLVTAEVGETIYRVDEDQSADIDQKAAKLAQVNGLADVDNDVIFETHVTPTDPDFASQWHHQTIRSSQAWFDSRGSEDVVIAVIDSGTDFDNANFNSDSFWVNEDEIPDNGIDDDENGYIDDVYGYDFLDLTGTLLANCDPNDDCTGQDADPSDYDGHGTSVASAALSPIDGQGVVGSCPKCKLMTLRAGYRTAGGGGLLNFRAIFEAIEYAAKNGADIINMSFGSFRLRDGTRPTVLHGVIQEYSDSDTVFVASAGNHGSSAETFPASFPEVISVSATDRDDQPVSFSAYGPRVDVAAPGQNLIVGFYSPASGGSEVAAVSGTSYSAPMTAGALGLVKAKYPEATQAELLQLLKDSARNVPQIRNLDRYYGAGILDSRALMNAAIAYFEPAEEVPPSNDVPEELPDEESSDEGEPVVSSDTGSGSIGDADGDANVDFGATLGWDIAKPQVVDRGRNIVGSFTPDVRTASVEYVGITESSSGSGTIPTRVRGNRITFEFDTGRLHSGLYEIRAQVSNGSDLVTQTLTTDLYVNANNFTSRRIPDWGLEVIGLRVDTPYSLSDIVGFDAESSSTPKDADTWSILSAGTNSGYLSSSSGGFIRLVVEALSPQDFDTSKDVFTFRIQSELDGKYYYHFTDLTQFEVVERESDLNPEDFTGEVTPGLLTQTSGEFALLGEEQPSTQVDRTVQNTIVGISVIGLLTSAGLVLYLELRKASGR